MLKHRRDGGVSLRTLHICMITGAAFMCSLMPITTCHSLRSFHHLTERSERRIELKKAARELMDASDAEDLFEKTDAAMARSKQSGKHTCPFCPG